MQLYMKQKVFSLRGKFNVYDAAETPLYTVEGKIVSAHSKHYVYNASGEQVAYIYKKILSLMPKFFIETNGKTYEMKGKLALAHEVSVIEELGWEIKGNFLEHDYTITQNGEQIATVHQKWLSWGDTYELDVADGVDEVLVLSVVLCFDIMHAEQAAVDNASSSSNSQ